MGSAFAMTPRAPSQPASKGPNNANTVTITPQFMFAASTPRIRSVMKLSDRCDAVAIHEEVFVKPMQR
jgi:hypothetical protein